MDDIQEDLLVPLLISLNVLNFLLSLLGDHSSKKQIFVPGLDFEALEHLRTCLHGVEGLRNGIESIKFDVH